MFANWNRGFSLTFVRRSLLGWAVEKFEFLRERLALPACAFFRRLLVLLQYSESAVEWGFQAAPSTKAYWNARYRIME